MKPFHEWAEDLADHVAKKQRMSCVQDDFKTKWQSYFDMPPEEMKKIRDDHLAKGGTFTKVWL